MKKFMTTAIAAIALVLSISSCSKSEIEVADTVETRFIASLPNMQTKATPDPILTRYIIEVYEGATATTASVDRQEGTTGSFTLTLKKNTTYSFVVWADYGATNFTATDLKAVSMLAAGTNRISYYGTLLNQEVTATSPALSLELGHAVAQVIYENTNALVSAVDVNDVLSVTYPNDYIFDASTGTVSVAGGIAPRTFPIAKAAGTTVTDYFFAPAAGDTYTVKMQLNVGTAEEDDLITLTNVPFRTNYTTRIKGAFSTLFGIAFTVSNAVEEMVPTTPDVTF